MDYVFYFDESFHDRKISIKEDGTINSLASDKLDNYIGTFWGCEKGALRENITRLTELEIKYKNIFTIPDEQEFKSANIKAKNYKFGLHSLTPNAMHFYEDLFSVLDDMKPILHIDAISKIEFMLRNIFYGVQFPSYVKVHSFIYTLTKFLITYKPKEVIQSMYCVKDEKSLQEFQKCLILTLRAMAEVEKGIERKEREITAFTEAAYILESISMENIFTNKIDFEYYPSFDGFCRLLEEKGISRKRVKLVLDKEEKTFGTAQRYGFKKTAQADSKNVIQIRLADFISGFIGRIVYALTNDVSMAENQIMNVSSIDRELLTDKRLQRSEWFKLTEEQYNLYRLIHRVLVTECEDYWTTLTLAYSDELLTFYTLLRYINGYETYQAFREVDAQMHREYYSTACCCELEKYYNEI